MNILYLFPDTNFFIQCRPLDEIDWSPWKSFDEVQIIVCRPVQREIDNQKNRGGDRVGKRARQTNALFRELIISGKDKITRNAGPKVLMRIDPSIRPSCLLKDQLDYSKPDDEIVGCVHAFRDSNSGADSRLLTHDSGPMATAKMLDLDFVPVPDEWLIPPESNDEERERRRIETELIRLKKAEPVFRISYLDPSGSKIESIEISHVVYESLKPDELAVLMDCLKNHFPIVTEFGRHDKPDSPPPGLAIARMIEDYSPKYAPPSDDEIESYKNRQYPDWITRCEDILQGLHHALNDQAGLPLFRIAATNEGTRPGKDVLVTIAAHGSFKIRPPEYRNDDDEKEAADKLKNKLSLPWPPNPPLGRRTTGFPGFPSSTLSIIDHIKSVQAMISPHTALDRPLLLPPLALGRQLDSNAFYYKEDRSRLPVQSFSLECEQWRHGLNPESFLGEIYIGEGNTEVCGALECTIHAENLSSLIRKTIPVRVSLTMASTYERAQDLVRKLIAHSR